MIEQQNTEIKIIRLNTGEDIIGNCIFDDENDNLLIDSPMKVVISRVTSFGKTMLIMSPWLPLEIVEENIVAINYNDIITTAMPKKEFIEYYLNTIDQYQALVEKTKQEEALFGDEFDNEDEMDEEIMEEMLEIIKEKKKGMIH